LSYVIKTPKRESEVTLAHIDIPGSGFERYDRDDPVLPARSALQAEVN
jgi:hypothetical protein